MEKERKLKKEKLKKKSLSGGCRHINNQPIYLDNSYRDNNRKLMTYYSNPIEGSKKVFHR